MEKLRKDRGIIKGNLTRFKNQLSMTNWKDNTQVLQAYLEKIEPLFDKFESVQSEIEHLIGEDEIEITEAEKERSMFEVMYYSSVGTARKILKEAQETERNSNASVASVAMNSIGDNPSFNSGIFLPKLCTPKFDGNYSNWVKFRDSFDTMINKNPNLKNIQKYHYLEQALEGEAARTIEALAISDENYITAWEQLNDRYEDTNELIRHHVSGILDASVLTRNSHTDLRQLLDTFNNHLLSLKALKQPTDHWDTLIIHILSAKLHVTMRNEWEKALTLSKGIATLKEMKSFLESYCKFLHKTSSSKPKSTDPKDNKNQTKPNSNYSNRSNNSNVKSYAVTSKTCALCKGAHALYACDEFKKLTPLERLKRAQELKICYNCLSTGHRNKDCKFGSCRKCDRKHNTLLHLEGNSQNQTVEKTDNNDDESKVQTALIKNESSNLGTLQNVYSAKASENASSYVLLATATIYITDKFGKDHECRALLDSCSQPHLITKELCDKLNLPRARASITLAGLEEGSQTIRCQATARIKSRTSEFTSTITCLVLDKISDNLPSTRMKGTHIEIPSHVKLADPNFNREGSIDLLIGASLFYQLLCIGQIKLKDHDAILQKTLFGWIVTGNITLAPRQNHKKLKCNLIKNNELQEQLEKFWNIENSFIEPKPRTSNNDPAEQHFRETTQREKGGRFIVSIPFKGDLCSKLGPSQDVAHKRLLSMEKKLSKDPSLKAQYTQFMDEYEALGHMTEISINDKNEEEPHFYLPHHAVIKQGSTTTKLRVVFDGSAKTAGGLSLNDVQYIGLPVQDDLFSIILRFRKHRYVLSADIAKMYRQILVKREHRSMQRILWRKNATDRIRTYELNTVTYGTASAPFLATRCLYELGDSFQHEYPSTSRTILQDFYVDDLLTGTDTIEEAIGLRNELNSILQTAGLELRKWASNEPRILCNNDESQQGNMISIYGDKDPKTLGLIWNPEDDTLKYQINYEEPKKITKRIILSSIAKIFDPLGLVGPAVIQSKIIMQKLWALNLQWDESLPQEIHEQWKMISQDLVNLNEITVERYAVTPHGNMEFHGFCDASETAYGACIYVVSTSRNNERTARLLCAKSRVAPLKATSIPRLELLGAVLLAQLAHKVSTALKLHRDQWHYWTDSMVTLAWIKAPSNRWKTFVANRTAEIHEITNKRWSHVASGQNPADLISRGASTAELRESTLWWTGPHWLTHDEGNWPSNQDININDVPEQKLRQAFIVAEINTERVNNSTIKKIDEGSYFDRFSSFLRLTRATAYVLRFINNCKRTIEPRTVDKNSITRRIEPLSTTEIDIAKIKLIMMAQSESFHKEISMLKSKSSDIQKTKLNQLNAFLDKGGLLRVGGRLSNAQFSFEVKHPIILASNHKLTHLLIKYEHVRLMHAGSHSVLSSLREFYWPLNGINTVKKILRECITCFKNRPRDSVYLMGDLPSVRVTPNRAFFNCGVDYAGPFLIKEKNRSRVTTKAYICIFVCLVTKAIHIEIATDLSTEAFLNCLKRFISRRGRCSNIYSDNGTNFCGANRGLSELKNLFANNNFKNDIVDALSVEGINWHFIPPRAPHFGGLWESAVKSAKNHLKRVIGETRLTFEELYTIMTQIEACLNSRPLSPLSNDPNDLTPLTPGHFLIGDSLTAIPQADVKDLQVNRLNRFQHLQQMLQHFWQRWQREYLPLVQSRQIYNRTSTPNIKPGTMVLAKEDNVPPLQWPLGRVVEVHPGKDGIVRVASIKVIRGIIKRPVSKICILPMDP